MSRRTAVPQVLAALAVLVFAACSAAPPEAPVTADAPALPGYEITLHSPDSWARYYTRIGLGTVLRLPQHPEYEDDVQDHCDFLTSATRKEWHPLGMSKERGYRLCYETGPLSDREAHVLCARLVMRMRDNSTEKVVCEVDPQNPPPPEEQLRRQYEALSQRVTARADGV